MNLGYDEHLARAVDRHTASEPWEGASVEFEVGREEWLGHHQVRLTVATDGANATAFVATADSEQGAVDLAAYSVEQRTVELTTLEQGWIPDLQRDAWERDCEAELAAREDRSEW